MTVRNPVSISWWCIPRYSKEAALEACAPSSNHHTMGGCGLPTKQYTDNRLTFKFRVIRKSIIITLPIPCNRIIRINQLIFVLATFEIMKIG